MAVMPESATSLKEFTPIYVLGFMTHPLDEERREEFHAVALAKIFIDCKCVPIEGWSIENFQALTRAANRIVGRDVADIADHGLMAGEVLLDVLQMQAEGVTDAGLDKAQHMTSELFSRSVSGKGTGYRAGRETVSDAWKKFRTVAHFWGAFSVLTRSMADAGLDAVLAEFVEKWKLWLAVANNLRDQAIACRLPKSRHFLLSEQDSWTISGVDFAATVREGLHNVSRDSGYGD